jgi:hypothetical protein
MFPTLGLSDDPYHDDSRGNGLKVSRDAGVTWTEITKLYVGTAGNGFGVVQLVAGQ